MVELEQELLHLTEQLVSSPPLAQLRQIRDSVELLAPRIQQLDPEQPAHEAPRRLYIYLDARSAAAVRDRTAAQRPQHAEIERQLLQVASEFRRSYTGTDIVPTRVALRELYEQIDALEAGTNDRWVLERLYNYAFSQLQQANARAHRHMTQPPPRPRRTPASSRNTGISPTRIPYRAPSITRRNQGFER